MRQFSILNYMAFAGFVLLFVVVYAGMRASL